MRSPTPSNEDRVAAWARAREASIVTVDAAQKSIARFVKGAEWASVAELRQKTIPVFDALMARIKEMGAHAACDLMDAYSPDCPTEPYVVDEPGRAEHIVRAAARLVDADAHECGAFVRELQTQLGIIYRESKVVCMDGQKQ